MAELRPYVAYVAEPEGGAVLVFSLPPNAKRKAETLAYPVLDGFFDDVMRVDAVARRLESRPDIMRQAVSGEPHVIDSPKTCLSCEIWGGEPRGDVCEFCEDPNA